TRSRRSGSAPAGSLSPLRSRTPPSFRTGPGQQTRGYYRSAARRAHIASDVPNDGAVSCGNRTIDTRSHPAGDRSLLARSEGRAGGIAPARRGPRAAGQGVGASQRVRAGQGMSEAVGGGDDALVGGGERDPDVPRARRAVELAGPDEDAEGRQVRDGVPARLVPRRPQV